MQQPSETIGHKKLVIVGAIHSCISALMSPRRSYFKTFVVIAIIATGFYQVVNNSLFSVMSQYVSADEPAHIGTGLELLQQGTYGYERMHPPLARVIAALPLYLYSEITIPQSNCSGRFSKWKEDIRANHNGGAFLHYCLTTMDYGFMDLKAAKAGRVMMWPFYLLSIFGVFLLAMNLSLSRSTAAFSAAFFSTVPIILWLGARVMTDLPFICLAIWVLVTLQAMLKKATMAKAILLGLMGGLAALAKFSALCFIPPISLAWLLLSWQRTKHKYALALFGLAIVIATLVVLLGWQFDISALQEGLETVALKAEKGHAGELFPNGTLYMGEWYFYPTLLLIRTPLPLLLFCLFGAVLMLRHNREAALKVIAASFIIMSLAMSTKININIHHIALIYAPLTILAGYAAHYLWQFKIGVIAVCAALALLAYPRDNLLSPVNTPAAALEYLIIK